MRVGQILGQAALLGVLVATGSGAILNQANARSHSAWGHAGHGHHGAGFAHYRGSFGGGLQCVPFARENTGIELAGNAANWWENAEGVYQRGARPEVGSVLNFRANGRMRMGHVAVVSGVIDGRNIEIDHANWSGHGGVGRNISVVDVSPGNDWSAVRVALSHSGEFGSIYPTYGFIYDRPDHGTMVANTGVAPLLAAAPRDLRPASERDAGGGLQEEEVAEASDDVQPRSRHGWSRHGRHELAGRDNWGTARHGGERSVARFGRMEHERPWAGVRSAHATAREVFGRPTLMRTQAHETGPRETGSREAGSHGHHGTRHRT